jgi:acyl-CoA oxidase
MTTSLPHAVDPRALTEVLDGRWDHVRRDARENLHDPDLLPVYGENVQEARERVTRMAEKIAASGRVTLGFPKEYGGEDDAGGSVTSIEMLAFTDLSLMVKAASSGASSAGPCRRWAPSGTTRRTCATS